MKKVRFNGLIYTVEEEFHDSYKLSGSLWVKKSECKEIVMLSNRAKIGLSIIAVFWFSLIVYILSVII